MKMSIRDRLSEICTKPIAGCTAREIYNARRKLVQEESDSRVGPVSGRRL